MIKGSPCRMKYRLYSIICLLAAAACSSPGPEKVTTAAVMGACQHKQSGVCIDSSNFTNSSAGCENTAVEAHLPGGCPRARRFASCSLKEGSFIVRVYNQAQLQEVDNLCKDRGGRWAYD